MDIFFEINGSQPINRATHKFSRLSYGYNTKRTLLDGFPKPGTQCMNLDFSFPYIIKITIRYYNVLQNNNHLVIIRQRIISKAKRREQVIEVTNNWWLFKRGS